MRLARFENAVLSGFDLGALRQGAGDPAGRGNAFLSAVALRRRQALCLLDYNQLPRSLAAR
jgi:hypothetical protein